MTNDKIPACRQAGKAQNKSKIQISNIKTKVLIFGFRVLVLFWILCFVIWTYPSFAQDIKYPNVSGMFYPDDSSELSKLIDGFLNSANPGPVEGDIFALISPHAGYAFSGQVSAFGYKLIVGKPYKTVIVIGPSHYFAFRGVSVYPVGLFRTPLGDIEVDGEFTQKLINKDRDIFFEPRAFEKEHSIEVELPFLQKALTGFKIVPIVMGDCDLLTCQKLAEFLKNAIKGRSDVLIVASSDMYHGYDYEEAGLVDIQALSCLKNMDAQGLYEGIQAQKFQLCGASAVVTTIILARQSGHNKLKVLRYTNSAIVTGKKVKGAWTVGYSSCVIDQEKACLPAGREGAMLTKEQRKKLLEIARSSIEVYLRTNQKPQFSEKDAFLVNEMGAFVTLREHGQLRGCIGNLVGRVPLYQVVRDMAIEAAVGDPRFRQLDLSELKDVEIEISVLSPLERISSIDKIQLGTHGVLVKKGFNSGLFLPQVATETGWTKDEFLSRLCAEKAGLSSDAWKDKSTEIYIFTAEVFSEKDY